MRQIILLLLSLPICLLAQQEANIWHFGLMYGLDFSSGTPVQLSESAIDTWEGCASYCDTNGQLLFYTNGGGRDPLQSGGQATGTIWNREHEVMYDMGFTEGGGWSATQSSLILPKPGEDSVYYLFTMEEQEFNTGGVVVGQPQGRGLSYFEIDMRLNNGLGEVTVADQRIYLPMYEGLSGTIHADGDKYWVIGYENNQNVNQFVRLLVDNNGIQQEDISLVYIGFEQPLTNAIKISPDGKWISCGRYLYQFNKLTGEITNPNIAISGLSGGSFTADSRYYYYWEENGQIARVDMTAADIPDSREIMLGGSTGLSGTFMQLAPNYNIYFVRYQASLQSFVGEIACAYRATPDITPELFTYPNVDDQFFLGLPNFADHIFKRMYSDSIRLPLEEFFICDGNDVVLHARVSGLTYQWTTGGNTDSLIVQQAGTYIVSITDDCGFVTIDKKIVTLGNIPNIQLSELPDILCPDQEYVLSTVTEGGMGLLWSTGDTTESITISESGLYAVSTENACGLATDEVAAIFEDAMISVVLDELPDSLCLNESYELTALPGINTGLLWSTGDTTESITISESGFYSVTVENNCGNTASDEVEAVFIDCMKPVEDCALELPNIFSPNRDGINDRFGVFSNCIPIDFELHVFNRWGQKIYETTISEAYWEGDYNDKPAPSDVYIYQLQYRFVAEEDLIVKTGSLTLMR